MALKKSSLLFFLSLSSTLGSDVIGIPRSMRASYAGPQFTCLSAEGGKTHTMPISSVNDEFCDCADGSDEPGTSACKNGRFYCPQKGFRSKFVPSSVVGDGVCDCCDGADEAAAAAAGSRPLGSAACKNTCEVDGASWRASQAAAIEKAQAGAVARKARADAYTAASTSRAEAATKAETAKVAAEAVKRAADATLEAAKAEHEKAVAAAPPVPTGDAAAEAALGIAGLDRAALLKLLVSHARTTDTGSALADAIRAMIDDNKLPGKGHALFRRAVDFLTPNRVPPTPSSQASPPHLNLAFLRSPRRKRSRSRRRWFPRAKQPRRPPRPWLLPSAPSRARNPTSAPTSVQTACFTRSRAHAFHSSIISTRTRRAPSGAPSRITRGWGRSAGGASTAAPPTTLKCAFPAAACAGTAPRARCASTLSAAPRTSCSLLTSPKSAPMSRAWRRRRPATGALRRPSSWRSTSTASFRPPSHA